MIKYKKNFTEISLNIIFLLFESLKSYCISKRSCTFIMMQIFHSIINSLVIMMRNICTIIHVIHSLRKHAYSNILKSLQPKNENFQIKNSDIFQISAQNIDCGYSLEPPRRV